MKKGNVKKESVVFHCRFTGSVKDIYPFGIDEVPRRHRCRSLDN